MSPYIVMLFSGTEAERTLHTGAHGSGISDRSHLRFVTFPDPSDDWPIVDHCAMEPDGSRYWFADAEVQPAASARSGHAPGMHRRVD
jgi:hypothetical protein